VMPPPPEKPHHKKIYFGVNSCSTFNALTNYGPAGFRSDLVFTNTCFGRSSRGIWAATRNLKWAQQLSAA
jgi:hypothetical protein